MNVNSSSNTYNSLSSSNNGITGLMSGMDTDALVEKMLAGQQAKIDAQNQLKQTTTWKQTMYRDVIGKISSFNTKYFDTLSSTSLTSKSLFNSMSSTTSSKAFSVAGSSSAISGEMKLKIEQLATASKVQGSALDGESMLTGSFDGSAFSSQVKLTFAEVKETITNEDGTTTEKVVRAAGEFTLTDSEVDDLMSGKTLSKTVGTGDLEETLTLKVSDGEFSITSDKGNRRMFVDADGSSAMGIARLGLTADTSIDIQDSEGKGKTHRVDASAKPSITFNLDGNTKEINFENGMTKTQLQEKLDFAFGTNAIVVNGAEDLSDFSLSTGQGRKIIIDGNDIAMEALGMKRGQSNTVAMGDTLEHALGFTDDMSVTINGVDFTFGKDETVSSMMSKINKSDAGVTMTYSSFENRFSMTQNSTGAGFGISIEDKTPSSTQSDNFNSKIFGAASVTSGENAKFTLNGVSTERSDNVFTIDGVTITLKDVNTEAETITTTRDTEKVFDAIKSFVEDYNKMIEDLNGLIRAEPTYKDYAPLTDAQRKEMSESEITAWEKKAKEGLLRGDSDISIFLSQMRTTMFTKPEGSSISLFDLGIDTSNIIKDNGKLTLDEDTLRAALEKFPSEIENLFTYSNTETVINANGERETKNIGTQGIAMAFKDIIKKTANTSSANPGVLVALAGAPNTATAGKNTLSERLTSITSRITVLKHQYQMQKDRYWKQFTDMEKALSNLSAQASWLTQQTGY